MDCFCKLFTILALIITCHLLRTVSSASLFGIKFEAPKNVIRKGVEKIPQIIDRIPFLNQKSSEHWVIPPSYPERQHYSDFNANTFDPTFHTNQFLPQLNHNNVYDNQITLTPKNQDPCNDKEDSGPPAPLSKKYEKYIEEEVNAVTETVSDEYDTDHTTTDDEWTTTVEPLNRIANPSVVASILG